MENQEEQQVEQRRINTKKKFIADGVFQAELNEFLSKSLGFEGFAGIEVHLRARKTEIKVRCTKAKELVTAHARKAREIQSFIEKRFGYSEAENPVEISFKGVQNRSLCAAAQAEYLKFKLLKGLPVRMAATGVINLVMNRGEATGCEVIVSGKLRGQRAKSQKYRQGYLVSTGQPKMDMVDVAMRHVQLRQGILGVKVKIMLPPSEQKRLPDMITIYEPKDDRQDVEPGVVNMGE